MKKLNITEQYARKATFGLLLNQIIDPNAYDTSGSEGSENSEGSEDSEGSENSEGSEDSEGSEGSEDKEVCENQSFEDIYAIDPQPDEWAPLMSMIETSGLTEYNTLNAPTASRLMARIQGKRL